MALTRKFLSALGIETDKIDEIINAHAETVDALKAERDQFKADAEKLPGVQKELDDAKKILDDGNKDSYKVKYEAVKEDFENYKKEQSDKEAKISKENAYKQLLKDAGISEKRLDAVLKVSDLSAIKLDENGKIVDAGTITKNVKEEWSDFIVAAGTKGAQTATPPTGTGTPMTKEQIVAIKDPGERRAAIAQNMNLFTEQK